MGTEMDQLARVATILDRKGHAVYSIRPDQTVYEAIELMNQQNVGAVLIMEEGRLLGVLSERDCARKIALEHRDPQTTLTKEIATFTVVTVTPQATVRECMELMSHRHIRHLPVLDKGKVVGVISMGDLVKWLIDALNAQVDQLQAFIFGQYPC